MKLDFTNLKLKNEEKKFNFLPNHFCKFKNIFNAAFRQLFAPLKTDHSNLLIQGIFKHQYLQLLNVNYAL